MLEHFLKNLDRALAKASFTSAVRLDLYRSVLLLLGNQVRLNEALQELYSVYSEEGKKPKRPVALVIESCLDGMRDGIRFSEAMSHWIPVEEGMLLQAGEVSGKLSEAFAEAEKIMQAKKKIFGAIFGAVSYPIVLFTLTGFLLHMVSTDLVPKLSKVVDPNTWTGAAAMLYSISNFVTNYGLLTIGIIAFFIALIVGSLGTFSGKCRVFLDSFPPWSIYRMVHGATFLLNVSALLMSGMQVNIALNKLGENTNKFLKERIQAILSELSIGKSFGQALIDCGYNFPDKKANRFLAVISAYSGLDTAMSNFGHRWLEETVNRIEKVSNLLLMIGVISVGITMLIVIAGAGGLQDSMQASVGS